MIVLAGLVGPMAHGQGSTTGCSGYTGATQNVCTAASDVGWLLQPSLGLLQSGGNPVLGTAAGFGKFGAVLTVGRATAAHAVAPDPTYLGVSDTVSAVASGTVYAPRVDISFGVLRKALPVGTVTADLLGSAVVIPSSGTAHLSIDTPARTVGSLALGFGYGVRLGFVGDNLPQASLSVTKRDLPRLRYGNLAEGDSYTNAVRVSAINVRLLLGQQFHIFDLSAGAGIDLYSSDAQVTFVDPATGVVEPTFEEALSTSRIMTVVSGGIALPVLRIGGELGFQVGKDDGVTTNFQNVDPSAGKFFGGFGVGLRF